MCAKCIEFRSLLSLTVAAGMFVLFMAGCVAMNRMYSVQVCYKGEGGIEDVLVLIDDYDLSYGWITEYGHKTRLGAVPRLPETATVRWRRTEGGEWIQREVPLGRCPYDGLEPKLQLTIDDKDQVTARYFSK